MVNPTSGTEGSWKAALASGKSSTVSIKTGEKRPVEDLADDKAQKKKKKDGDHKKKKKDKHKNK